MPHACAVELVIARDPLVLLERAADGFLTARRSSADDPFPSPPYLLALRQGGLRDDLIRLAAERGIPGWIDPPLCTFAELPERLGQTNLTPCDDFERAIILGGVLRQFGGDVFGRLHRPQDFIGALDRLFGELVPEGVSAADFKSALERRGGRDFFERQRDGELAVIYEEYLARLAQPDQRTGRSRRDGRDTWLDCARAAADDPAGLGKRMGGRRELRLFGLQDLRGGWCPLIRALQQSPALDRLVIYTAEPLELGLDPAPAVTRLDEPETIASRLFLPVAGTGASPNDGASARSGTAPATDRTGAVASVDVIAAPDVEREVEEVARRVRALADGGVPLTRIAIVTRQARPYMELALGALEKFGVPATARRRFALQEVPVVRAVRALLAAAAGGWTRHGLVELAEQPYFESRLDARLINFAGFRRRLTGLFAWRRALDELARQAGVEETRRANGEEPGERPSALPLAARASAAAAAFHEFAAQAAALDQRRPLARWVEWLRAFLTDDPWGIERRVRDVPAERFDIARLDAAGWKWLSTLVERWRGALEQWGGTPEPLDAAGFYEQLEDLLEGDVAIWTEMQRGVQVLEGFAAAYRAFDHVFLVGLEAGRMPLPLPSSPILDEPEREALRAHGLPLEPRDVWDRRERELFQVLVAGARNLTISYPACDLTGRDTVRSAFVDALGDVAVLVGGDGVNRIPSSRVITPGIRLYTGAAALERARTAARIEWDRASGALSPWNGLIESPALRAHLAQVLGDDRVWSPTQLEGFAKCPWSFFSGRLLKLNKLEDPDEEMDAATRGTLLHDALARFYRTAKAEQGRPVFLRQADLAWALPMVEAALAQAIDDARGRVWLGNETLLPAKVLELKRLLTRYLTWEAAQHEEMYNPRARKAPAMVRTGVDEHELEFNDVVLERGGVRFRFRGFIDRVEVGVDDRFDNPEAFVVAVDYKTTKYAAPAKGDAKGWADHVVLQVPLYAYALTQLRANKVPARVEYRAIKSPDVVLPLQLYTVDKKTGQVSEDSEAKAQLDGALDAVATHVLRARGGEFPAEPAPSCGCPSFCHALEICRVAGGPQLDRQR
ncbi:MAG TPA: PD-(D/E)XK nuclease family protein [Gemmatimonadales bacterium]|nr:PD-(D/E)XK nuclease family protein [Gemmatimonadales bacterium]